MEGPCVICKADAEDVFVKSVVDDKINHTAIRLLCDVCWRAYYKWSGDLATENYRKTDFEHPFKGGSFETWCALENEKLGKRPRE